jgi:hypothetical protein
MSIRSLADFNRSSLGGDGDWLTPPPSPPRPQTPGRHDERGMGTFTWPPARTSTWPYTGTFSWPRTASLAPFRAAALRARRLPRTAAPPPAATGPRRNASLPRNTSRTRPPLAQGVPIAGRRSQPQAGTPRIVRVGPSSVNGAPHPRSARTRLRRAVDPGASANPAGLTARARPEARPKRARRTSKRSTAECHNRRH